MKKQDFINRLIGTWVSPTFTEITFSDRLITYNGAKTADYLIVENTNSVYDHGFEITVMDFKWFDYAIEFIPDGKLRIAVSYINEKKDNQLFLFTKKMEGQPV